MGTPLPGPARRMLAGVTVSALGTGLTLPFTIILLHEVRGFTLPTSGLLLAIPGVVGLAAAPVSGTLIDRIGARRVLQLALLAQVVADVVLSQATTVPVAAVAFVFLGVGLGPSFPAASALLSGLVHDPGQMARAFGIQFTLLNAGIGVSALIGALVVDVSRPLTFSLLYLGNAASGLLYAAILPGAPGRQPVATDVVDVKPSYREVFSDPAFRMVFVIGFALALTGYAALDSGLPAFARVVAGISPATIATAFTVNTVVIVGGQLVVIRWLKGRRRTSALAGAAALWGLSWLVLGLIPLVPAGGRGYALWLFAAVFAAGETLLAPALNPLVNAIATDRLRGRYNAMSGASFGVAFVVSPAVSSVLIGSGVGAVWIGLLVVGSLVVVGVSRRLRMRLTPVQDAVDGGVVEEPAVSPRRASEPGRPPTPAARPAAASGPRPPAS